MGAGTLVKVSTDTNVLVSAFLFGGLPAHPPELWRSRRITPLVSQEIMASLLLACGGL